MRLLGVNKEALPVATNPKGRNNPHLCITGQSGTGKSTLAEYLVIQEIKKGKKCIVFNWHNCMNRKSMNPILRAFYESHVKVFNVGIDGIGLPLFSPMPMENGSVETEKKVINRLTEMIADSCNLAMTHKETVFRALTNIFDERPEEKNFEGLISWLDDQEDRTAINTLSKLRSLFDDGLIKEENFLECESNLIEINLNDLPSYSVQKDMLMLILDYLNRLAEKDYFTEEEYLTILIDEAQNLVYKEKTLMRVLLQQCRKSNLKLILALPSFYTRDKDMQDAVLQCATVIYFQPKANDIKTISNEMSKKEAQSIVTGLKRLERGSFYADGNFLVKGQEYKKTFIKVKLDLDKIEEDYS